VSVITGLYAFFLILTSLSSLSTTVATDFSYTAPKLYNSETWTDKINTDNTKNDAIYVDKNWKTITDNKIIKEYQSSTQGNSRNGTAWAWTWGITIPNVPTNINFQWFVTPTTWNGSNYAPHLYRYLYKNWLTDYKNIKPFNFYYGWYYYFFRNNGKYSYTTDALDLNKTIKSKFIQNFRTHDLGDKNDEQVKLSIDWNNVDLNLSQGNSSFKFDNKEVTRHAYFNNKGELIWPNVFNTKSGSADNDIPQNLSLRVSSQNNWDWTSNLSVNLWKQINKNVIVWNWNWSEYDLVYRQHVWDNVNKNSLYDYAWQLYNKYNNTSFSTSLWTYTIWRIDAVPDYDVPRMYAKIVPQYSWRNDYFLPVEIYNWTISMDVFPTHSSQHFWIVSTKNSQRRFTAIMDRGSNSMQKVENANTQPVCPWMLNHWYNEWYKLMYNIETRNWKQEIKVVSYRYDRDWTSWHVRKKENECSVTFNSDYSWWKPNIFNHSGYGDMGLGQIIIIPRDKIWKIWHPGWTISSYYNPNTSHPNNIAEFLSMINKSVDSDKKHFYWQNTYMYPMFAATDTRLDKNWRINHFWSGNGGDLINHNQTDHYANIIKGYFNAKTAGKYCFAVDWDDYVGTYIDWKKVVAWTWWHGWDKQQWKYHHGCVDLSKGFHNFVWLHEEIDGGDNFIFYVKNPGDSNYHVISPEKGEMYSTIFTDNGADYKTTDNYYQLPIKWLKNKEISYTVKNSANIMLNGIKYYGLSKSTMNKKALSEYAYNLLLNRNMSIYNDDLEQDINSYNAEFWLDNTWIINYNLLSSIDRIGGIRNFDIMEWSDNMWPHNLPNRGDIPNNYYAKDRNQKWYNIDTSWLYNEWLWFSPLWLKWRKNTLRWYILYSDLKQYWKYGKLGIINNVSSYTYSGDNDYRSYLYSNSDKVNNDDKSIEKLAEQPWTSNQSKENSIYFHKNNASNYGLNLTFPDNNEFKLNNNYIYDNIWKKITQNDKMWYFWVDTTSYDYAFGWDIWMFTNNGNNDSSYRRTKSYYNEFKIYNITLNKNQDKIWLSKEKPALSCAKIYDIDPKSVNGYYWIKLDNSHTYKLFCDFREPFRWITEYLDIKKNYSFADAKSCWQGSYIYNDKLECYNPNRYTSGWLSQIGRLYIFNNSSETDGWYWLYNIKNQDKNLNKRQDGGNYNTLWNNEWMTIMSADGSEASVTNSRWIWLWVNFEHSIGVNWNTNNEDRQYGGEDSHDSTYMNYSENSYWKTPWSRENSVKKWKIFWKEPLDTP